MNNRNILIAAIVLIIVLLAGWYFMRNTSSYVEPAQSSGTSGSIVAQLQMCPDEWIVNKMPTVTDPNSTATTTPNEYYVYQGTRREVWEFDRDWIAQNCSLTAQEVF